MLKNSVANVVISGVFGLFFLRKNTIFRLFLLIPSENGPNVLPHQTYRFSCAFAHSFFGFLTKADVTRLAQIMPELFKLSYWLAVCTQLLGIPF